MLRGLRPQAPDTFGLNPPSQLVLGVSLVCVSESGSRVQKSLPSSLLTTVEYKIDHISKTKNRTKKNSRTQISDSEHCAFFRSLIFFVRFKTPENCEQNY